MINCNILVFSFLAFLTMWVLAFADDLSGIHTVHRTSALCGPRVLAQLK